MKLEFKWCNLTVVAYLVTSTFFCQAAHSQANSQESRTPVATQPAPVPAEVREAWRKSMVRRPLPKKGCFKASYPSTDWQETTCTKAPEKPYLPAKGTPPEKVGNGHDFSAHVTGIITTAEGSFTSATGLTSDSDSGGQSDFALQLNTEPFSSPACSSAASPTACQGWQQFIYSNSGVAFMQYWLLGYNKACPSGWNTFGTNCWTNSSTAASVPTQQVNNIANLTVTATAGSGGLDSIVFSSGTDTYTASEDDNMLDLSKSWNGAEYNIVGDCCGTETSFNSGSNGTTIVVRTGVDWGSTDAPSCKSKGFTGETNNLNLVAPCCPYGGSDPNIQFMETNAGHTATCGPTEIEGQGVQARITVWTGNDDARSDTELWATINGEPTFCLKPSNNANSDSVCNNGGSAHDLNGNQSWNNWTSSTQTFSLAKPLPLSAITTLTIQLLEHNSGFESDDNWDIQGITVMLTDSMGAATTVLNLANARDSNNDNNCLARLKGSPNSTTVAFGLNGTKSHVYVGGKAAGQTTNCSNNGD
ncbi:MAG: hypothetical protein WBA18_22580 [Terracidiphilus sp.]